MLACCAPFVRRLHIGRNDRVTNGTLALALQRALDILAECQQPIFQVSVGEHDNTLDGKEPALPLSLVYQHSASTNDHGGMQWVSSGKCNRY